ncbi:hypothetical protein GOQ29_02440 [Clostridium sp. D2Q-14]|uniref:hypothetical protein n=1 Tax=Anaeromonas gelatinilytica TaxID=2683194 RepID=UPI00193B337E|nr:hypothetical protein [Anaeromonas gelatinilytica]MBS4534467.1 hypothetical protein [Anaeromonas gelatinilytica]
MSNLQNDELILKLVDTINVPVISDETNFWIIKTQNSIFYDEFISNSYVGLSWNTITKDTIDKSNKSSEKKAAIKEHIRKEYGFKQPGRVLNECDKFVNSIKENDIIIIPSRNNEKITFALAKKYYEDNSLMHKEKEYKEYFKDEWNKSFEIKCSFTKRREIQIIKTITNENLNPHLYNTLVSKHGVSKINESYSYILSTIYPVYYYQHTLATVFRVKTRGNINALDFSYFLLLSSSIIKEFNPNKKISVKTNIQSPGDVIIELADVDVDILSDKDTILLLLGLWSATIGGKFLGFEFRTICEFICMRQKQKEKLKSSKLDNKNKNLDNIMKNLNLKEKLECFNNSSSSLNIDISEINNIIDLSKFQYNQNINKNKKN